MGTAAILTQAKLEFEETCVSEAENCVFSYDEINQFPPIDEMAILKRLSLFKNHGTMKGFPVEICCLTNLNMLSIKSNELSILPQDIKNLVQLKELRLSRNLLTTLPPEIGENTNLRSLCISLNHLVSIPKEIKKLKSLTSLCLSKNNLDSLPIEIGELVHLKELIAKGNRLEFLPSEIGNLSQLVNLDVSYNLLKLLPEQISHLVRLKELHVRNNKLVVFPPEIGILMENYYLIEFNIYYNPIVLNPKKFRKSYLFDYLRAYSLLRKEFQERMILSSVILSSLNEEGQEFNELPGDIYNFNKLINWYLFLLFSNEELDIFSYFQALSARLLGE